MHESTKQQSARDTARETWRRGGGLVRPRINKAGGLGRFIPRDQRCDITVHIPQHKGHPAVHGPRKLIDEHHTLQFILFRLLTYGREASRDGDGHHRNALGSVRWDPHWHCHFTLCSPALWELRKAGALLVWTQPGALFAPSLETVFPSFSH